MTDNGYDWVSLLKDSIANAREVCVKTLRRRHLAGHVASTTTVEVHHKEGVSGERPKESPIIYL